MTPAELIGSARKADVEAAHGRAAGLSHFVGQAEGFLRAAQRAGLVVVSAEDYRYLLDRTEQYAMSRFDADDSVRVVRLRWAADDYDRDTLDPYMRHFSPNRMRQEVEAKRRILSRTLHHASLMGWDEIHGSLLRMLASPYASHEECREGWVSRG